ncbi:hypothetical protein [Prevotella sp. 10(H)]|uniref:hypothetical protein n=1 Tax=Prevotella sp. 10(H) TaxID=1158294 RepID=UPI0012DFA5D9|nr:hypothetical protein [Prevotella sp. 10(H)]
MKREFLFSIFIISFTLFIHAQDSIRVDKLDIIYLKNGKVLKGLVVKSELGTLTVKTTDSISQKDKIQIYQQGDIKKIEKGSISKAAEENSNKDVNGYAESNPSNARNTKRQSSNASLSGLSSDPVQNLIPEQSPQSDILRQMPEPKGNVPMPMLTDQPVIINAAKSADPDEYFDPFSVPRPKRRERIWNREIRGFRVFLDYAYIQGIGKPKNHRLEWGTSLGFQFNPIFYTGIGTAYSLTLNNKDSSLPIFINPRINFLDENTTPFWDVKFGYSVAMGQGVYFSTSLGVSLTKKGKRALNLGLVYSLQYAKYYEWSEEEPKERIKVKPTYHGLAFKLTYEFGIGR